MRRRRAGHALPGADAGCAAVAGRAQNPPAGFDEQPQIRCDRRRGNRSRRSDRDSGIADTRRCARRDGRQESRRLFHRGRAAGRGAARNHQGSRAVTTVSVVETPVATLRRTTTIRERCRNILNAVDAGRSSHFRIDRKHLNVAAARVEAVTRRRYPDLNIPYHSRWRHFATSGIDRKAELDRALVGRDAGACARAHIDLAVVSVLLDAGAGPAWRYVERETGLRYTRSEGLGVASFRAFMAGAFSARRDDPLRADAAVLSRIDAAHLARLFQVDASNPIVGLE